MVVSGQTSFYNGERKMKKVLLSMAGFDPTGGAGILLDMKVFQWLGYQGVAVISAQTVQNTRGVERIAHVPPDLCWDQYHSLHQDINIDGIKVGMLGFAENIEPLGRILHENPEIPKVVDPVFHASSGEWLLPQNAIADFMRILKGRISLLTPNLHEASLITGMEVTDLAGMEKAARQIFAEYKIPVLVKGGHLGSPVIDLLYEGTSSVTFQNRRIAGEVHGTGCCLSSAVLSFLAAGHPLKKACREAIDFTHVLIKSSQKLGQGKRVFVFPD
jgi:hydroxymethylpyrimidine/phosphomethylpyrimidine kinase